MAKIVITDICKHWLSLLLQDIDLKKLASVGSEYCESLLYKLNPFWKAVFMYYKDYKITTRKLKCQYVTHVNVHNGYCRRALHNIFYTLGIMFRKLY